MVEGRAASRWSRLSCVGDLRPPSEFVELDSVDFSAGALVLVDCVVRVGELDDDEDDDEVLPLIM